jgi:hypothetical protein
MRELLKSHLLAQGRAIVNDEEMRKEPVKYVQSLIALRQKFADITWRSFAQDKDFQRTLKEAFELFLNAPGDRRPAEFLSASCAPRRAAPRRASPQRKRWACERP